MFNLTDLVFGFLVLLYAFGGWRQGFVKSLLGPISFIVCFVLAWMYFKKTHNILIAFSISILGPFFIKMIASWIIDVQKPTGPGPLNRALGTVVSLTWGMTITILIIMFLVISPTPNVQMKSIRNNVVGSAVFALISPQLANFMPMPKARDLGSENIAPVETTTEMSAAGNPTVDPALIKTVEYQNVINDPRIRDLYDDPEVKKIIEDQDYMKLLQNPKFAKILDDPQLIGKLLKLQSKIRKN
ncbi:MAG: CvpA family protein [Candidatus Omnitrophica bacterium]|nr:CvpA family protein [Candidatus Omnitrophota bacterium]